MQDATRPNARRNLAVFMALLASYAPGDAPAADVEWLDFSGWLPAQDTGDVSSADLLDATVTFSNLDRFDNAAPAGLTHELSDPDWTFTNREIRMIAAFGTNGAFTYDSTLTIRFTNPGGLPTGGSIGLADLETAGSFVVIDAFDLAGASITPHWRFATFDNVGTLVPAPSWDPGNRRLDAPPISVSGDEILDAFAFLTTDMPIGSLEIRLFGNVGDGIAFGATRATISAVPLPFTGLLLASGLAGLGFIRRRR
ncbi:MAG: hypothetical protein AB7O21_15420 [Gammaproteobacteria bacterium]